MMPFKSGGLLRGMALALAAGAERMVIDESTHLKPLAVRRQRMRREPTKVYVDSAGMPHGCSGDKLVRKAMTGQVGMTKPKGWMHTWASTKAASMGFGDRRRAKG